MKHFERQLAVALASAALGMAAAGRLAAQDAAGGNPPRRYTERVRLHDAPDIESPEDEAKRTTTSPPDLGGAIAAPPAGGGELLAPVTGYVPPIRPRAPSQKEKKANWILPPSPDGTPAAEEPKPSGWGWLADESLKLRQDVEAKQQEASQAEEEADAESQPATSRQTADETVSLRGDTKFEPVQGLVREKDDDARAGLTPAIAETSERDARRSQSAAYDARSATDPAAGAVERSMTSAVGREPGLGNDGGPAMPRTQSVLAQVKTEYQNAMLPTYRDELNRYQRLAAGGDPEENPVESRAAPAPGRAEATLAWGRPTTIASPEALGTRPGSTYGQPSEPAALGFGIQPADSSLGALPGAQAGRSIQPFQPVAPMTPISGAWTAPASLPAASERPVGGFGTTPGGLHGLPAGGSAGFNQLGLNNPTR